MFYTVIRNSKLQTPNFKLQTPNFKLLTSNSLPAKRR